MKKKVKYLLMLLMTLVLTWGRCEMSAEAANVRTGTLGTNGGVQWTYDVGSKTLTLTGSDSGLSAEDDSSGCIYQICSDVEKIIMLDFKPIGDVSMLFAGLSNLKDIETDGLDTSEVCSMRFMLKDCNSLRSINLCEFNTVKVLDMSGMFYNCYSLRSVDLDSFDTASVTDMSNMFAYCSGLSDLNVSGFDTALVKDMSGMFFGCAGLTHQDLSNFNTVNVKSMARMFGNSNIKSVDLSHFNTSNVESMVWMFGNSNIESLDLSHFNTAKVQDMEFMFGNCVYLRELDIRNWDTSNVTNMQYMFQSCDSLKNLDLSHFETSNVTNFTYMFYWCSGLTKLDLSGFNITTDENYFMLSYCPSLTELSTPGQIQQGITLPLSATFEDSNGNKMSDITGEHCNKTLKRKAVSVVFPQEMVKGETKQIHIKSGNELLDISENLNYDWESHNENVVTISADGVITALEAGMSYVSMIEKSSKESLDGEYIYVVEVQDLGITAQPVNKSVEEDASALFEVMATGNGLSYQWQFKTSATASWRNSGMTGSNSRSIVVRGTKARNGYQYRCIVTDRNGNEVISNAASLTVQPGITISGQPTGKTVEVGESATFKVEACGYNLKYQWQFKTKDSAKWINSGMTGAKTSGITVQGTKARSGYQYRCVVTDSKGNKVTSNAATLTVQVGPTITGQPENKNVAVGENASFEVTATGTNLAYQWQVKKIGDTKWTNSGMTGSTTSCITVQGTKARNGYQYRCVITDRNGNKVTSNGATLTVQTAGVTITGQPASKTVTEGEDATFKVTATGTGLTYQWQVKTSEAAKWTNSGMTGSKTNSITVKGTKARNGYQYRCVVTDGNGNKVTSSGVMLTVK